LEDHALNEMYQADKDNLKPGDETAYRDLIEEQREGHKATIVEVKDANTGESNIEVSHNIGDKALSQAMAVHSESWHNEEK
ncbi:MAG TPA: hypothetical protein VFK03_00470, partial [Candidatus Saccharimonadales bacterium]|nr:hypothetical protein [Candidatus Saccharimonadales bacterium]